MISRRESLGESCDRPFRPMETALRLTWILIVFTVNLAAGDKPKLVEKPYVDPRGFFRIFPPEGWQTQEFQDDPRGKVKFVYPGVKANLILVIGQSSPYADLKALRGDLELQNGRMKAKVASASFSLTDTMFQGSPALQNVMEVPGMMKQVQVHFLSGGMYFTLCYGSTPALFEDYRAAAMNCLESLETVAKNLSPEEARRHAAASKLRTARLMIQLGQTGYARTVVQEGLALDPENPELLKLKQQIDP
ncbi:MAG: hypothetical protein KA419_14100 [Acidobacteria bacterium]|nr:hypothetical protein [Acidobacteriota bacterium]